MKKAIKKLIFVGVLFLAPVLLLLGAYYYNHQQLSYNFQRNVKHVVKGIKAFDLKYNSFYFAGCSENAIYLGNSTATLRLVKVNASLTDTQHLQLNIKKFKKDIYDKVYIDSSYFYLFNGVTRSFHQGNTNTWKAEKSPIFVPYFQLSIPLSSESAVFRYIDQQTNTNTFRKESTAAKRIDNHNLLEKQIDGRFCTDGMLEYNRYLKMLIYVYYYRNQILLIDTNLNLIKKMRTIDPVDSARFKISSIKADSVTTFSSPRLVVNSTMSYRNQLLFIASKIMGRYEDRTTFRNSTIIDVYDLKRYTYLYSFYLPDFMNYKIRQFSVQDGYIYTLSDQFIIRYAIDLPK